MKIKTGYFDYFWALEISEAIDALIKYNVQKALEEQKKELLAKFLPPEGIETHESGLTIIGNKVDMEHSRLLSILRDRLRQV